MKYGFDTISDLAPGERQKQFIYLLDDLKGSFEVMKYLVQLGQTQRTFSVDESASAGILEECSLNVRFLFKRDRKGRVWIRVNSESRVVQGVLSIFAEVYQGSVEKEIRAVPPVYQNYLPQGLAPSFERKDGVKRLYYKLLDFSRSW